MAHARLITRRRLLGLAVTTGVVGGTVALRDTRWVEVTRHREVLPGLEPGHPPIRVVQLSDLHRGPFVDEGYLRRVADLAMELKGDLVLVTGDFVSRKWDYAVSCARALSVLSAPMGVWGVWGNHDHYAGRMPKIRAAMDAVGIRVLVNDSAALEPGLYLAGFDDHDTMGMDPERAFRAVPKKAAAIVMGHNPLEFGGMRLHGGVMFSGHTHGCQVAIWPVPALVAASTQGRVAGWYSRRGARLLVNRGIGTVNLPFRMFSRPEVAVVDLVPDGEPPVRQGSRMGDRGTT